MATAEQGIPSAKRNRAHERSLTFMVMGKVGKVRSFRLSRRLLFWALLFFAVYLPFSAYLVNRYFDLSQKDKAQQGKIELLEKDLSRGANALSRAGEHILFLEDYIFQMENRGERASQPGKAQAKTADNIAGGPPDTKVPDKEQAMVSMVSVDDLVMEKKGGALEVHFKIVNLLPGDSTLGGYVHLTAKGEGGSTRPEWTYPQVKRVEALPESFQLGRMFLIRKFKPMEAKLLVGSGPDAPTVLEILVYDQSGRIMLRRDFPISPASS
jgi:hypothetical protein